jgi:hypothetical protein
MTTLEAVLLVTVVALLIISVVTYRKFNQACKLADDRLKQIAYLNREHSRLYKLKIVLEAKVNKLERKKTPKPKRQHITRTTRKKFIRREKDAVRNEILKYMK